MTSSVNFTGFGTVAVTYIVLCLYTIQYISILRPPTSSRDGYDSDDSDYNDDITEWQQVI